MRSCLASLVPLRQPGTSSARNRDQHAPPSKRSPRLACTHLQLLQLGCIGFLWVGGRRRHAKGAQAAQATQAARTATQQPHQCIHVGRGGACTAAGTNTSTGWSQAGAAQACRQLREQAGALKLLHGLWVGRGEAGPTVGRCEARAMQRLPQKTLAGSKDRCRGACTADRKLMHRNQHCPETRTCTICCMACCVRGSIIARRRCIDWEPGGMSL